MPDFLVRDIFLLLMVADKIGYAKRDEDDFGKACNGIKNEL